MDNPVIKDSMRTKEEIRDAIEAMTLVSAYARMEKADSLCLQWEATFQIAQALEWVTGKENKFGEMIDEMRRAGIHQIMQGLSELPKS